jgi:hypothetical protein
MRIIINRTKVLKVTFTIKKKFQTDKLPNGIILERKHLTIWKGSRIQGILSCRNVRMPLGRPPPNYYTTVFLNGMKTSNFNTYSFTNMSTFVKRKSLTLTRTHLSWTNFILLPQNYNRYEEKYAISELNWNLCIKESYWQLPNLLQ